MAIPLLICDDSNMARKQMARALPESWDTDITFAANGVEALKAIRAGRGEIVFLDLTMPEMDGFAVLETIRKEDLPTVVIVVSGDIQPIAQARVAQLGALCFIHKPVDKDELQQMLQTFGLL